MDITPVTVNLTPSTAAAIAAAMIEGRWAIVTEYGDDTRVVAIDDALQALADTAGLAPGVIQQLARLIGEDRRGDIFLRVFAAPGRYAFAYSTIVEWSEDIMVCALTGATLEW